VQRYERARPGELLHLDVKKLGRIGRVGHRDALPELSETSQSPQTLARPLQPGAPPR
jgi:hypothetical protein